MIRAAYFRAYRAAHPEYRARQNELRRQRRAQMTSEQRNAERGPRKSRALVMPDMPVLHSGHPLFDSARQFAGPRRGTLRTLYDPFYDDLVSEAVLAFLEGRDVNEAVLKFARRERSWGRVTAPLIGDWAA